MVGPLRQPCFLPLSWSQHLVTSLQSQSAFTKVKILLKFLGGCKGGGYNTHCTEKLTRKPPSDVWVLCNAPTSYYLLTASIPCLSFVLPHRARSVPSSSLSFLCILTWIFPLSKKRTHLSILGLYKPAGVCKKYACFFLITDTVFLSQSGMFA